MSKKVYFLSLFLIFSLTCFGQVELSSDSEAVKTEKKKKRLDENKANSIEAFVITNWSFTTRSLIENVAPYGDTLGTRNDEGGLGTWSYGIGIRSKINNFLTWEGGISFWQNGESYLFEGGDSTFKYETTYTYIGMPLKIQYSFGDKAVEVFAGIGISPQMFVSYKREEEYTNPVNETLQETVKTKSGYNSFVLSALLNVGVKLNLGSKVNLLIVPEYRHQLITSYQKQDDFKHFGRAIGINFGISYNL